MQREHRFDRRGHPIGAFAIRLVDHEDVGDFHDPGLERLHVVAGARHQSHDRDVGGADNVDLVLADADGLDNHDVLAAGVEHERGLARRPRQAAEVSARRHAADEHAAVAGMRLHSHPIAKNGAATVGAGGVDRDDADGLAGAAERRGHAIDERALAGAGRSGDAEMKGAAGLRENPPEQLGAGRRFVFDQRDGAGDGPRIAVEHAGGERRARGGCLLRILGHCASSCRAITRRWISLVPSPMVRSLTSRKYFSAG